MHLMVTLQIDKQLTVFFVVSMGVPDSAIFRAYELQKSASEVENYVVKKGRFI